MTGIPPPRLTRGTVVGGGGGSGNGGRRGSRCRFKTAGADEGHIAGRYRGGEKRPQEPEQRLCGCCRWRRAIMTMATPAPVYRGGGGGDGDALFGRGRGCGDGDRAIFFGRVEDGLTTLGLTVGISRYIHARFCLSRRCRSACVGLFGVALPNRCLLGQAYTQWLRSYGL